MRLFIALDIPEDIRNYLTTVQHAIGNTTAKIAWDAKKKIHITLKFLGNVPEQSIPLIKERLKTITFPHITTTLTTLGFFPTQTNPRVLWIGIKPDDQVLHLQRLIDQETLDLIKTDASFHAHITLGRIKTIKNKQAFLKRCHDTRIEKRQFITRSFTLYNSTVTSSGSKYTILEQYPLQ